MTCRKGALVWGCGLAMLAMPGVAAAQEGLDRLCAVLLHQERVELEDLELAVGLEATRFEVQEEVYQLLHDLWQEDLVEGLIYLGAKHRRDAAAATLAISRRRVERQSAVLRQYELACGAAADEGDAMAEARGRYEAAECAIRRLEVDLFTTDLDFEQAVLASARNLRQSDVASRQQVLFAERDVELTTQRLEQARHRAASCGATQPG